MSEDAVNTLFRLLPLYEHWVDSDWAAGGANLCQCSRRRRKKMFVNMFSVWFLFLAYYYNFSTPAPSEPVVEGWPVWQNMLVCWSKWSNRIEVTQAFSLIQAKVEMTWLTLLEHNSVLPPTHGLEYFNTVKYPVCNLGQSFCVNPLPSLLIVGWGFMTLS